jgi:hypothetical protein
MSTVATVPSAEEVAAAQAILDAAGATKSGAPPRYKVIVSLKTAGDRVLFSSVSEKRTKAWVENHCPRGSHFFMLAPDGSMSSYEAERATGGPQGEDLDTWQPFDRDAYQAPELAPVNVNDPWADAWEGAQ